MENVVCRHVIKEHMIFSGNEKGIPFPSWEQILVKLITIICIVL